MALSTNPAVIGRVGIDQTIPGDTNAVSLLGGSAIVGSVSINQTTPGTTNGVVVTTALPAGAALLGKVGIDQTTPGTTNGVAVLSFPAFIEKQSTPTVTNGAYAAATVVGGLLTLTNVVTTAGNQVLVQSAIASFKSGVMPAMDIFLFNDNPSASTFTDNAAIAINVADLGKVRGVVHVTDYSLGAAATMSVGQGQNQGEPIVLVGTTLYAVAVLRAAATLTSTSDLFLTLTMARN